MESTEVTPLSDILDSIHMNNLYQRIIETRVIHKDDSITYGTVLYPFKDNEYEVTGEHVSVDYVFKFAKSSCNFCSSKGYGIHNIEKSKLSNPEDYTIVSKQPVNTMSEDQKKIWIEKEKRNPLWRVLLPCHCVLRKAAEKEPNLIFNNARNIIIRVTYRIK